MALKTLVIDTFSLERALSNGLPDVRAFLDTANGRVVVLQGQAAHDPAALRPFDVEPGRFILVEPLASRIQHAWMLRFSESVVDPTLRAALTRALDGAGAFHRFKKVLRSDPRERERWYRCRSGLLRAHIGAWLSLYGISPVDSALAATLHAVEDGPGSGEQSMRRVAGHYIDRLPEASLRLAIVYLRYRQGEPAVCELAGRRDEGDAMNAE